MKRKFMALALAAAIAADTPLTDISAEIVIFKDLDLFDKSTADKFIPDIYKYNSEHIRLEILRGLMDTDGSVYKNGIESKNTCEYCWNRVVWRNIWKRVC